MPPITDAMLNQLGPLQNSNLEQRVRYLENTVEPLRRGFYGDVSNNVPSALVRLERIETRLEAMARHALYWRIAQTILLVAIGGMVAGAMIR